MHSSTILVLKLNDLQDVHYFSSAIKSATEKTSNRLLIILFSHLFDVHSELSHTQSWNDVQSLLTTVYVEATRVSQEADRILMDVDVLLSGLDHPRLPDEDPSFEHVFRIENEQSDLSIPNWMSKLPLTTFQRDVTDTTRILRTSPPCSQSPRSLPSTYPVIALGGTFDHLHSGHKILLSMSAWIAHEKVIVGVTDDKLLQKKSNRDLLESLEVRTKRVKGFLEFFKPGLVYDIVPIDDVYGPTAVDPYIQALAVSKETLSGASSIAKLRDERGLPPLECFVIDVISATSTDLATEDMDLLRQSKMSSTFIREWIRQKSGLAEVQCTSSCHCSK